MRSTTIDGLAFTLEAAYSAAGCSPDDRRAGELVRIEEPM
jgi:hypothetical protein